MGNNLDDICLDAPKARDVFQKRVVEATAAGWLEPNWDQSATGVLRSMTPVHLLLPP